MAEMIMVTAVPFYDGVTRSWGVKKEMTTFQTGFGSLEAAEHECQLVADEVSD